MEDERLGRAEVPAVVEDAAPVARLDVVARNLRDRFGARYVSFPFLDVVGRKVVRVAEEAETRQGRRADRVSPTGGVHEHVLCSQRLVRARPPVGVNGRSERAIRCRKTGTGVVRLRRASGGRCPPKPCPPGTRTESDRT
ncbi:hypothetical protein [Streptomyces sp. NPDC093071]|uniref:hypothetical protein n=1 Tax=Streptomyces sp. NPDC093071 TaxID=3366022 RepID=UPI0037F30964